MGFNIGAFGLGLSRGLESAQSMDLRRRTIERADRADERDAELHKLRVGEVERTVRERDKNENAMQQLADLVGSYTQPQPSIAATGVKPQEQPAQTPAAATAPTPPAATTPSLDPVPAAAPDSADAAGSSAAADDASAASVQTLAAPGAQVPISAAARGIPGAEKPAPKTPDDAIGYGLWRSNGSLFRDPAFNEKAAKIFLDAGLGEKGLAWLKRGEEAAREGGIDALRRLVGGDVAGAEDAFNRAGGRFQVVPGSTREAGNGKYEITLRGGQKQVIDPRAQLRSYLSPKEFFELKMKQSESDARIEDRQDRTQAQRDALDDRRDRTEETKRANRANEDLRRAMLSFRSERGGDAATAMERNIEFMVKHNIAKDHSEAFDRLHTAVSKPDADATRSIAGTLMKGSGYRGRDGATRAFEDAANIVRSLRAPGDDSDAGTMPIPTRAPSQGAPGGGARSYQLKGKTFTDADIEATARKHGITPDQVKRQLGIQ